MFDDIDSVAVLWLICQYLVSFGASVFLVGVVRQFAQKLRFTDYANSNTGNKGGAALGGGLAIVVVFVLVVLFATDDSGYVRRIAPTVVIVCVVGLLDDLFRIPPHLKIAGQLLGVSPYLYQLSPDPGYTAALAFFLVLSSNAWNVVDVMDSLLATIGTMCFLGSALVLLSYGLDARGLPGITLVAAGSLSGFLVWNRHPARVIMGDSGSLSLGMLYGIVVVEAFEISPLLAVAMLLPGLIPFWEVGFLIVQRSRRGIPFYRTTPDHFALRMLHNGRTVHQVIWRVLGCTGVLLVMSWMLVVTQFHRYVVISVVAIVVVATIWTFRFFDGLPLKGGHQ